MGSTDQSTKATMHKPAKLFILMTLAVAVTAVQAAPVQTAVTIDAGPLQGQAADGVIAFKGIPYARPPVGALRWRAPQPVAPWLAVRDASKFGADCMQAPFGGDAAPLGVTPAEDCLYVNVWRPQTASAQPMPVMVWLHGGGFVNGGSSAAVYDGSGFAQRGVILVSLNYRLGRFGYFAHPALSAAQTGDAALANYGYMDQLAALRWVQRNIRAFGGDPANVTLFGESAGGSSALALMTTPLAQGLFQKLIVQSGGGRGPLLPMREMAASKPGLPSAESVGEAFAKKAGIAGTDAAALAQLRALPAERLVDGLNMGTMFDPTYVTGPIRDGVIVTGTPDAIIARGAQLKVPVMIGATGADLSMTQAKTKADLFGAFGPVAAQAQAAYDPDGKADVKVLASAVGADKTMVEPARLVARLVAAQGLPAYTFRFSYVAEALRKGGQGATHASDVPYVFDTVQARYKDRTTQADVATAQAAIAYWVAFAKRGDPNTPGQPHWPRATATGSALLDFSNDGPVAVTDPWRTRLDLVEAAAAHPAR
jgi:para-nitrobenzyl esterase